MILRLSLWLQKYIGRYVITGELDPNFFEPPRKKKNGPRDWGVKNMEDKKEGRETSFGSSRNLDSNFDVKIP